ncbi:MAG: hypothetical protein JWR26_1662 [Pedosphaera sp.]|nr:hypothetical protein [Pedosphaera sp.]
MSAKSVPRKSWQEKLGPDKGSKPPKLKDFARHLAQPTLNVRSSTPITP